MAFGDIIQRAEGTNGSGTTTCTATFGGAITSGNLIVAIHMTGAASSSGVTNGDPLTLGLACANATESDWVGCYYRIADASEPSLTFTATSGASDENALLLLEIEGPWEASPVDINFDEGRHASATSYAIGTTGATSQNDEVAVAFVYGRSGGTNNVDVTQTSWSDSFVEHATSAIRSDFKEVVAATKLLTAAGTIDTTFTYVDTCVSHGGVITFKKLAAAGGGGAINLKPARFNSLRARVFAPGRAR